MHIFKPMQYYLGIDIGTTSAKAVAFSLCGEVITADSCSYKMYHPQPSWSEQDPDEVFKAAMVSSNNVISSLATVSPKLVAFSSYMHGLIAIDKDDQPLTKCIIWADNRATDIADRLKESGEGRAFYQSTGVPVHAMSPLCKLIWLKENEPAIFKKASKFISIKEYIYYKMFGEYIIDTSVASGTGLFNIKNLSWDEKILNFLDITPASLSKVVSVKHQLPFKQIAVFSGNQFLISPGTPLIIGGSDGALANLGTGAVDPHAMAISIGTSGAARIVSDKVETDTGMRTFCYHLKDSLYIIGGASNNGAVVLEWLKDKLLETKETYTELFERAAAITPGSEDLILIPYILGERAPVWNSNARGVYFGLNINHTKSHLIRACMEGIVYAIYSIAKILLEKQVITEIHATGGFAQSSVWLQMLADICNIKVCVSGAAESSALGAVMIGMEALNIGPFARKEILSTYEPDLLNHEVYMKSFERFERIYDSLKDELIRDTIPLPQMPLK
ncbi:MAG: gluconokinase [Ginsengibacter sp.]